MHFSRANTYRLANAGYEKIELNEEELETYQAVAEAVLPILFQAGKECCVN